MSSYKSFAVVGFGVAGSLLADEFVKSKVESPESGRTLRILTRSKDKSELRALSSRGVDVVSVDYTSLKSITDALKGVDVVLSALRDDGLDLQTSVVHAAKAANVKLFVPSEYGRNTLRETSKYLKAKADTQALLKELGLPYVLFFTGIWPEILYANSIGPHLGIDLKAGKFELFGDGNVPLSWTTPRSFIPLVYRILTTLPASQLENQFFEIEGERTTFRELIALWEAKHGKKAEVTVRSQAEIQKFFDAQTLEVFKFMPTCWMDGSIMVSGKDNGPGWKPLTWKDLLP